MQKHIAALGIGILIIGVFFWRSMLLGEVVYCCDNAALTIPIHVFATQEILAGRLPVWNPHILSGMPLLADISHGILYPSSMLFVVFPPFVALTNSVIVHVLFTYFGMYLFLRRIGTSWISAIVGGILWSCSGAIVTYINNLSLLQSASYVPWILWGIECVGISYTRRTFVILLLLSLLQICAGHPQMTYYSWLFAFSYIVFRTVRDRNRGRVWKWYIEIGLFVALLSAIQTLPFLELAQLSTRIGRTIEYATADSLQPFALVRFILPSVVGVLKNGIAWAQGGSVYGYIGTLAWLCICVAPKKHPAVRFFGLSGLLALILAFGKFTPVFGIFYSLVPGISLFRVPQHFLLAYTASFAIVAAFGVDEILTRKIVIPSWVSRIAVVGLLVSVLLVFFYAPVAEMVQSISTRIPLRPFQKIATIPLPLFHTILRDILINASVVFACWRIAFWCIERQKERTIGIYILTVLLFAELLFFSRNGLLTISHAIVNGWLDDARSVVSEIPRDSRIYVDATAYPYPEAKGLPYVDTPKETGWQFHINRTNIHMLSGLSSIDGYTSLPLQSYQRFFTTSAGDPAGVSFGSLDAEILEYLGVSAQITNNTRDTQIIRRSEALSKIRFSSGSLNIIRQHPGYMGVRVTSDSGGRVEYIETLYPGWRVYIDGVESETLPVKGTFMGALVSPGQHVVEFIFRSATLSMGAFFTAVGWILLGIKLYYFPATQRSLMGQQIPQNE